MILFTIHWLIPKTDWERGIKPSISFLLRLRVYRIWVWSRYKELSLIDKHESNHSSFWAFFNISSNSWSAITHVLYFRHSELSTSLFSLHSCNCISSIHFAHCGSWKPFTLQSSKSATCCLWMVSPKRTSGPMASWRIPIIANDAATIIIPIPTFLRWWGSFIQSLNLNWWHLILKEIQSQNFKH